MIAAIYARVSTDDQKCALQLTDLREYAHRSGWEVVEYIDHGVSGTKRSRPGLDRLMSDARQKKFDVVLVWKMDRFGRSLQQLVGDVDELDRLGVRFIVPSQGIDTDQRSPIGRFMRNMFSSFAEFERDLIVERVRAGVADAKRRGTHCGRPYKVFARDEAQRLRESGMSWRRIGAALNIPQATIRLALSGVQQVSAKSAVIPVVNKTRKRA